MKHMLFAVLLTVATVPVAGFSHNMPVGLKARGARDATMCRFVMRAVAPSAVSGERSKQKVNELVAGTVLKHPAEQKAELSRKFQIAGCKCGRA